MMNHIATFFSHFGAVRFQKQCEAKGWQAQVRPVPRNLSSSCGTCVYFAAQELMLNAEAIQGMLTPELEQIVAIAADNSYVSLYMAPEE